MKKLIVFLGGWLLACCCIAQSQFVVITANGTRSEYVITDFGKLVPRFSNGDTTLTVYSPEGSALETTARMVSFSILPPEEFEEEEVVIEATSYEAEFSWPKVEGANTYTLVIYEDENREYIRETLTFNRDGRLVNRDQTGLRSAPESFDYTVTGLDPSTEYYYTIAAIDAVGLELNVEQGSFSTLATSAKEQEPDAVCVYSHNHTIVVKSPVECDVIFYDNIGRMLGSAVRTSQAWCKVQLEGVYMVRVNGRTYKLLVW
ncbi:MAG: fibronectin type III domain-containing protein [Paludibacteraceae bacterium]|nr:fibronectin type III domain-containing protein [Paludibacteraceae bacterium]